LKGKGTDGAAVRTFSMIKKMPRMAALLFLESAEKRLESGR